MRSKGTPGALSKSYTSPPSFSNEGDVTLIIGSVDKLTAFPSPSSNPSAIGSPVQKKAKHAESDAAIQKGWQVELDEKTETEEKHKKKGKAEDSLEPKKKKKRTSGTTN